MFQARRFPSVLPLCLALLGLLTTPAQSAPAHPCEALVARLPNLKRALCDAAELKATPGRSVQGRTIYARDVSAPDAKLRVLVVGAMHGDELSSAAVALHWIQHAVQMPANAHWRFIPALNPDGLLARPARRTNANGVDLNRNFPTPNWQREAKVYWEQRTRKDPRRWPGSSPLSEPESRFLHDEMARFQPHLIVSIHAPYGVLDFDGPGVPPPKLGRLLPRPGRHLPRQPGQLRWRAPGHAGGHGGTAQRAAHAAGRRDAPDVDGHAALDGRAPAPRGRRADRAAGEDRPQDRLKGQGAGVAALPRTSDHSASADSVISIGWRYRRICIASAHSSPPATTS